MQFSWNTQYIRLSVFSSDTNIELEGNELFESIFGVQPDVEEKRAQGSIRRFTHEGEAQRAELIFQPNRVDIHLLGKKNLDAATFEGDPESASIGAPCELRHFVEPTAAIVVGKVHNVIRLAVGGMNYAQTTGREASYRLIDDLVPGLTVSPETTSDFSLQMNKFKPSKNDPSFRINRLAHLSALQFSMFMIATQNMSDPTGNYIQLTLDVNTDAENTEPFTAEQQLIPGS